MSAYSLLLWLDIVVHILANALMFVMFKNVANLSLAKQHCPDIKDAMILNGKLSISPRLLHLIHPHLLLLAVILMTSLLVPSHLLWTTVLHRLWLLPSHSVLTITINLLNLNLSNIFHIPTITKVSQL